VANLKTNQKQFELRFQNVVRGGDTAFAPNGEPYIAVSGGSHQNTSEDPLAAWWLMETIKLADGKTDTLYWRTEPSIENGSVHSRFATN
jgi:hypothetical protein